MSAPSKICLAGTPMSVRNSVYSDMATLHYGRMKKMLHLLNIYKPLQTNLKIYFLMTSFFGWWKREAKVLCRNVAYRNSGRNQFHSARN